MALRHRIDSVLAGVLALAFYGFFMFTKHDPALSAIIPFANDPYDAIGSFGVVISALLVILALFRAFRPYPPGSPSPRDEVFLARTQIAVAVSALVTLVGDVIAMARHTAMWTGASAAGELIALMAGLAAVSVLFLFVVRSSVRGVDLPRVATDRVRVLATCGVFVAVLGLYPEGFIDTTPGELLSIAVGILLLFVPISVLAEALVGYDTRGPGAPVDGMRPRRWLEWVAALLVGIVAGGVLLLGEAMGEHGGIGIPLAHRLEVVLVFVGAATLGMLVAYASLRRPLGLFARSGTDVN